MFVVSVPIVCFYCLLFDVSIVCCFNSYCCFYCLLLFQFPMFSSYCCLYCYIVSVVDPIVVSSTLLLLLFFIVIPIVYPMFVSVVVVVYNLHAHYHFFLPS